MYIQIGSCPHCGALIYIIPWHSVSPPPLIYTCKCIWQSREVITTDKTMYNKSQVDLSDYEY